MKKSLLVLSLVCLPSMGAAQGVSFQEQFLNQLASQGFTVEQVSRTLLGRTRILSTNDALERETVINPRTGHVLRDVWSTREEDTDDDNAVQLVDPSNQSEDDGGDDGEQEGSGDDGSSEGSGQDTGSDEEEAEDDPNKDDDADESDDSDSDDDDDADESDDSDSDDDGDDDEEGDD